MCLGVPGKIIEVFETDGMKMGKIDFDGVASDVCLAYVPEAEPGQYVINHVGFAISLLNEDEALNTLDLLQELMEKELANPAAPKTRSKA